jgi:hypothetical protein
LTLLSLPAFATLAVLSRHYCFSLAASATIDFHAAIAMPRLPVFSAMPCLCHFAITPMSPTPFDCRFRRHSSPIFSLCRCSDYYFLRHFDADASAAFAIRRRRRADDVDISAPRYAASLLLRRLFRCAAMLLPFFDISLLCHIIFMRHYYAAVYADFRRHFAALRHAAIAADAAMILV